MKLFSEIEKTIERGLRQWTERAFGPGESDDVVLVHRGILEEVESKIQTVQRGKRVFPYNRLTVRLVSADEGRRALYQMAFGQDRRLEKDLRQALDSAQCEYPAGFSVAVETVESGPRTFEIDYAIREAPAQTGPAPAEATGPGRVIVVRGKARQDQYALARPRTLIGRMEELTDTEQRVLRRNDIVFEEGADEANSTVSRRHAQILYNAPSGEYRIADDGSEYGTRIFRDGRGIEVPPGNRRGERLRPGDEIYLGRACLRFER